MRRVSTVTDDTPAGAAGGAIRSAELVIGGMTCASCAARVEKKLNKLDGVTATVNFATETAPVTFPATVSPGDADLGGRAGRLHRGAARRRRAQPGRGAWASRTVRETLPRCGGGCWSRWRWRSRWWCWRWSRRWQFRYWQWVSLALASPVAVWGAWPFHRAALVNARHGAATMDTLISVGVAAAYLWSLYALFFGAAGTARHADELRLARAMAAGRMPPTWRSRPG